MESIKDISKKSKIFHKKTLYCNIKRYNSPIFTNDRFKNYLLVNDNINKNKKSFDLKITKSSKNMDNAKRNRSKHKFFSINNDKNNLLNIYKRNDTISKTPYYSNSNENIKVINYIKKKITFQSYNTGFSKRNSNDNIFNNIYKKVKITNNNPNKNKNSPPGNSNNYKSKNNSKKKNYTEKIYLDKNNKKNTTNKKKYFYSSKLSLSLENILSKTINKTDKKPKQKSFEKSQLFTQKKKLLKNKFSVNEINKTNLKLMDNDLSDKSKSNTNTNLQSTKINLEKKRKIYRHYRKNENKIKSENMTDIMSCLTKSNLLKKMNDENRFTNINPINNINDIIKNKGIIKDKKIISSTTKNNYIDYKKNDKQLNINKDNSELILNESYNDFNDAKILCEYNSTNDKSLNTRNNESHNNKISITPNINMNKYNKFNFEKNKKSNNNLIKDHDDFVTYEFEIDNEQNYKINGVKTNNFDVKKPKDENLKFTFMKEEKDSEISVSRASKIIIGNIDGYKDIIETDIKNNENTHSKCFSNLINKKSNLFNNTIKKDSEIGENCQKELKKKMSNLSTLLKKESGGVTFNDCNFYDSFNMTNNLDGISSTITNNIINEKKFGQISNISIIKNNNNENLSNNNTINKKTINTLNSQSKTDEVLKKDDLNTNCIIY